MPDETARPSLLEAYRRAYLIRHVETEIARRYHPNGDKTESPMRCPVHLSVGQETIAVGVAMAIEDAMGERMWDPKRDTVDYVGLDRVRHVWFGHRSHAPYLAFGGNLDRMIAELYGKATGCSGGVGGSMHLHDAEAGLMGGTPIVGSAVSLATGSAWAAKLDKSQRITVVFCGDAVPETGQFWESLNFASLHGLRLLYVIEDNGLSTATPKKVRQAGTLAAINAYALKREAQNDSFEHIYWWRHDSFEHIYWVASDLLVDHKWPKVLVCPTTRACAHVGPEIDHDALAKRDPIAELEKAHDYASEDGDISRMGVRDRVELDVRAAFAAAEAAPWPEVA